MNKRPSYILTLKHKSKDRETHPHVQVAVFWPSPRFPGCTGSPSRAWRDRPALVGLVVRYPDGREETIKAAEYWWNLNPPWSDREDAEKAERYAEEFGIGDDEYFDREDNG